ncbi:putative Ty3/Gypsy polyprotein/retrotransposon [Trifolium medium]|uniref:Putative Ty3/Gypsy polyprotein/retrotransposon n=1 Tax=Trifolium medium TaxID=97028 RepID=A0A392VRC9_9FABA|nr:putative Ty3/Gypsy polyprotein/retrotransposon [Trifolium medium]
MNNKPPIFKGGYDPDGAQKWIEGIERIFGAMRCLDEHKVLLGGLFYMMKLIIGGGMRIKDWELVEL